jgi:dihydrofolate reductase
MRTIIASQFVSLDGFMDEPGRWTMPFWNDGIASFMTASMGSAGGLILGRKTYEGFAAAWPGVPDDEGGREMNGLPKYVATRTLTDLAWNNSSVLPGDLVQSVTDLKATDGGPLLISGSASVFNQLLVAGLVDEVRLLVYPVLLRGQLPAFTGTARLDLTLTSSETFDGGVLGLVYRTQPSTSR